MTPQRSGTFVAFQTDQEIRKKKMPVMKSFNDVIDEGKDAHPKFLSPLYQKALKQSHVTDFKPQEGASLELANALYDRLQAKFGQQPCTNFRDMENQRAQRGHRP